MTMSSQNGKEWFEILEIKTERKVYVNSCTGKCQWKKPEIYKKWTATQWWELFDFNSKNFYYYNSQTNAKTWIKPNATDCVSLVKLQVLKERNKKSFIDQDTQTSFESLHKDDVDSSVMNGSDVSFETSGYYTYKSDNRNIDQLGKLNSLEYYEEHYSTVSSSRKPILRTNKSNYPQSTNLRLSHPIIHMNEEANSGDLLSPNSLTNNYFTNMSLGSIGLHEYTDSNESNNFPRDSSINACGSAITLDQEIWRSTLFTNSGSRLAGIMSWTSKSIQDSLLNATPKAYKKKACENFKQIQMYMGDRQSNYSKETLAFTICRRGISSTAWSNEIFMQLCKQVTYNPDNEKAFNGWELICICLMFFHPESIEMKNSFKAFLSQYSCADRKLDQNMLMGQDFYSKSIFCARISLKLLEMANRATEITVNDIQKAKKYYASPTIFFSSLNEVMDIQRPFYPNRKLPWIQVALTKEIIRCGGPRTQGILRVPSEVSKVEALSSAIEKAFRSNSIVDEISTDNGSDCDPLLHKILDDLKFEHDPLLLSSVLKYWLRNFRDPLISFKEDEESLVAIYNDFSKIEQKINSIPEINHLVLKYLIYFLQVLARPGNVLYTNMPVENLVTLMAPTLFKLDYNQLQPAMHLIESLIINLDTSDVENMI